MSHRSSLLCLLAACAGPVDGSPASPGPEAPETALHEHQGRELLGSDLSLLEVIRFGAVDEQGQPFDTLTVERASLQATRGAARYGGQDRPLLGAILRAHDSAGVTMLRIAKICPHGKPPSGWQATSGWVPSPDCAIPSGWRDLSASGEYEYEVLHRRAERDPWRALCPGGWNRALPIAGTWTRGGAHVVSGAGPFSFACTTGVVAKCVDWGYQPWISASRFALHQACTRMARADYCGSGESHTVDGTLIDMGDQEGIRARRGGLSREAAWGPDGAICLSAQRWNTLPVGGTFECIRAGKQVDPRTQEGEAAGYRYCEEYPDPDAIAGALLYNDSSLLDQGLFRWLNRDTGDHYTTSKYVYGGRKGSTPPGPSWDFVRFEGAAFRRDLPAAQRPGTVPLYSWRFTPRDHVTTVNAALPGATPELEGYVYQKEQPQPENTRPIFTWKSEAAGDHITTADTKEWGTMSCVQSPCQRGGAHVTGDGYSYIQLEGYLPRYDYIR